MLQVKQVSQRDTGSDITATSLPLTICSEGRETIWVTGITAALITCAGVGFGATGLSECECAM